MKKLLTFICLGLMIACKKDYNCACETLDKTGGNTPPSTVNSLIQTKNRTEAENSCRDKSKESTSFKTTCALK